MICLMSNFGFGYMGSKNRIAQWIIDNLPEAEHFYDLFGGGGAISHCALLSGKYKQVHYNEIDPLVYKGFKMAINGDFKNENRWISREDFHRLKDYDPYAALCFSFGNNCRNYAFNQEIEPFKKAVHFSIVFNDNSLLSQYVDVSELKYETENIHERRIYLQRYLKKFKDKVKYYCNTDGDNVRNILQSLERLIRLQSLERLNNNLELTNLDYRNIEIKNNSIIYCDIPYKNTNKYKHEFNHNEFYDWCIEMSKFHKIYISEYSMPDNFRVVAQKHKKCCFSATTTNNVCEKLFEVILK